MARPVVIVGTGLAGYSVARELRKLDAQVPIVLLSQDGGEQYAKPNLSTALAAQHDPQRLVQATPAEIAAKLNITVRAQTRVTAIDTAAQTVEVAGEAIAYRDLVLAVGADPLRPSFLTPEVRADGRVLQVNDLQDYRRWRVALQGTKRIVVIGAGLIGVEFAHDLATAGYAVEVVDMAPQPLGRLLPPEAAERFAKELARIGIAWRLGQGIAVVRPDAQGVDVVRADGQTARGDLVLVSIGLAPRLELARTAGIQTTRAIAVDAHLKTSAPHVYALGDCAEVAGQWLPFVPPLLLGAKALAATLAGQPTAVVVPPQPIAVKTAAWPTVVLPPPPGAIWQTTQTADGLRAVAHDADGGLRGFVLMGAANAERAALLRAVAAR